MTQNVDSIVEVKNRWLYQQIDVEFPTKESLLGRAVYQKLHEQSRAISWQPSHAAELLSHDIYLVDFHRLTVMFALLQSQRCIDERDRNNLIEFLTQIIYSPPCELFLGFENGTPVAAAILTQIDNQVLVSDLVVLPDCQFRTPEFFATQLVEKLGLRIEANEFVLEQ
jgi:hypothetical protein